MEKVRGRPALFGKDRSFARQYLIEQRDEEEEEEEEEATAPPTGTHSSVIYGDRARTVVGKQYILNK